MISLALACGQEDPRLAGTANDKPTATEGIILTNAPRMADTGKTYLFYLHGRIIEEHGKRPTHPEWGVYEYEKILQALKQKGLVVISEARPKGTDVNEYAPKIVGQVRRLLENGVPPENITVLGASKGGIITMLVSTLLKERQVNFVTIAACNPWVFENIEFDLHGNILSIYEESDPPNGSCQKAFFERSQGTNRFREIKLNTGLGHGLLYRPLAEWLEPAVGWALNHTPIENGH